MKAVIVSVNYCLKILICVFALSGLDCCNALLYNSPNCGILNMKALRRETIPLLSSSAREGRLFKGFCFTMGHAQCVCICKRMTLPGKSVHAEMVREIDNG